MGGAALIENLGFKRFSMSPWNAFFNCTPFPGAVESRLNGSQYGSMVRHRCAKWYKAGYLSARTLHQGVSRQTACREFLCRGGRTPPGFQGRFSWSGSRSASTISSSVPRGETRRPEDYSGCRFCAGCDASANGENSDYDRASSPRCAICCRGRQYRRTGDFPFARRSLSKGDKVRIADLAYSWVRRRCTIHAGKNT